MAAKEVIKKGCNLFVIIEHGYEEQLRMWTTTTYTSRTNALNTPNMGTASTSSYYVLYALPNDEVEIREAGRELSLQIYYYL